MDDEDAPSFGRDLQRLRRDRQLTQEELAEQAGISARAVSDLERGVNRSAQRFTADRLADALKLSGDERNRFIALSRPLPGPARQTRVDAVLASLPSPRWPLLGRTDELNAISDVLLRPQVRLVTVTGTAGVGKTRLVLQLAIDLRPRFPDGVLFVSLAAVTDARLIEVAISRALQVGTGPSQPVTQVIGTRQLLIVLDNYEQFLPDVTFLQGILETCPGITVLVTSRSPLHLAREVEVPLGPLPLPDPAGPSTGADLEQLAVVQLFAQRARAVNPRFQLTSDLAGAIADIATAVDGLPLAIELAAARSRLLSPPAILRRLDRRIHLLTTTATDAPERHASLRNAIDWSYDLLDLVGQRTFRSLSVFAGGFTLDTASQFFGTVAHPVDELDILDQVAALVDRSLVVRRDDPDGEPRFSMLPTIQEYALDQLVRHDELRQRRKDFIDVFAHLTLEAEPAFTGPNQLNWFQRLEADHANIRQALRWALGDEATTAVAMAGHLIRFWDHHSHLDEGQRWLSAALTSPVGEVSPLRGKLLWGQGTLSLLAGEYEQAVMFLTEGVEAAKRVDDAYHAGFCLNSLGSVTCDMGDVPRARHFHQEGLDLMRTVGDQDGIAALLGNLGYDAILLGDFDEAITCCRESLTMYRQLGSQHGITSMLTVLARATLLAGQPVEASRLFREGLRHAGDVGNKVYIVDCLQGLAFVATARADWSQAAMLFGAVEKLSRQMNYAIAPYLRDADDEARRSIIAAIAVEGYTTSRDQGRAMSLEEVLIQATG